MPKGKEKPEIVVSTEFVCVLITLTVVLALFVTYAFAPSGVIAMPLGVEKVEETVAPVEEVAEVLPAPVAIEGDVEAMGKRGRKSKAEIAEEHKKTREDIESNYANLIAHEPSKADLFREELRNALKELGL